jgi:hypothetical protein
MQHISRSIILSTLFIVVILSGCDYKESDARLDPADQILSQSVDDQHVLSQNAVLSRILLPSPQWLLADKSAREIAREDHGVAIRTLGASLDKLRGASIEQMDVVAADAARSARSEFRWSVENIFAQYILDATHHRGQARSHVDIVDRHTRILVATESQRADLIAPSLLLLSAGRNADEIRSVAATALQHAERWSSAIEHARMKREQAYPGTASSSLTPNEIETGITELRRLAQQ